MATTPEDMQRAVKDAQSAVTRALEMLPGDKQQVVLRETEAALAEALAAAGMTHCA